MNSKKLVIIYGNCHTAIIKEYLNACIQFQDEYTIYPLEYIQNIKNSSYFHENKCFKECDVFIHQSIQKSNRYGESFSSENIIKLLKKDCKIIAIPNVYHLPICFFPQYEEGNEFRDRKGNTIFFRDKIIDSAYKNGRGYDYIYEQYFNLELFCNYDFSTQFRIFIEKVRNREKDWDIKVADFILQNYKDKYLFYDPNHPTNFFMEYVSLELLKLFGILKPVFAKTDFSIMDTFEMPLYASTKKYFQLNIEPKDIIRISGRKIFNEKMTLENYTKQYLAMEWQNVSLPFILRMKSFLCFCNYKLKHILMKILDKNYLSERCF